MSVPSTEVLELVLEDDGLGYSDTVYDRTRSQRRVGTFSSSYGKKGRSPPAVLDRNLRNGAKVEKKRTLGDLGSSVRHRRAGPIRQQLDFGLLPVLLCSSVCPSSSSVDRK
jgi:hypothetical protein